MAKKKTTTTVKKKTTPAVKVVEESVDAVKTKFKLGWVKALVIGLVALFLLPIAIGGLRVAGTGIVKYYKMFIVPSRVIPDIIPDFSKRKDRGINWKFLNEDSETTKWIQGNIPGDVTSAEVVKVGDCFFRAANEIHEGRTTTPNRSLTFLKKELLKNADERWEDFLRGLTTNVAYEDVKTMDNIASLYEDIGNALIQASKKVKSDDGTVVQ